jgi:hypothetical protein
MGATHGCHMGATYTLPHLLISLMGINEERTWVPRTSLLLCLMGAMYHFMTLRRLI